MASRVWLSLLLLCSLSAAFVQAASSAGSKVPAGRVELFPYTPVANSKAMVVSGNARFTVLTDRLIRIEWSRTGSFEDRYMPLANFH